MLSNFSHVTAVGIRAITSLIILRRVFLPSRKHILDRVISHSSVHPRRRNHVLSAKNFGAQQLIVIRETKTNKHTLDSKCLINSISTNFRQRYMRSQSRSRLIRHSHIANSYF